MNGSDTVSGILIDLHRHSPAPAGVLAICQATPGIAVPEGPFSAGIHPASSDGWTDRMSDLKRMLKLPDCCALGECGLDHHTDVPPDIQLKCFAAQVALAEESGLPLILHTVRADQEIRKLKRDTRSAVPWIIHNFRGSPDKAAVWLDAGFLLSIGRCLLYPDDPVRETLRVLPSGTFFLETDDSPADIAEMYAQAAALRGETTDELKHMIAQTYQRIFQHER